MNGGASDALVQRAMDRLKERGSGDSYSSTFINVDAAGNVTFDFTGHVHAQGLDLDAPDTLVPPSEDRIRWLRLTDGSVAADISGTNFGDNAGIMTLRSYAPDPHLGPAETRVLAEADNSPNSGANDGQTALHVVRNTTGIPGQPLGTILVAVGNDAGTLTEQRTILESTGKSGWIKSSKVAGIPPTEQELFLTPTAAIAVPALGIGANAVVAQAVVFPNNNGPATVVRTMGTINAGVAIVVGYAIVVNNAAGMTINYRFQNVTGVASGACNYLPALITDKEVR